jgi:glyoxylase-like metal-dependent hydrolase (beta-lactamase superfamily II)
VPTFPNARYLLARPEFEHWRDATDEQRAAASAVTFDDAVLPLFAHDVVDLVDVDHAVTGEIALMSTPGHTPGHVSVRITSRGEEGVITGDCVHTPFQLAEPQCGISVDADPAAAHATRTRLVDAYADRPVLLIGTHFPPPTAGHLVTTTGGVRFQPLADRELSG